MAEDVHNLQHMLQQIERAQTEEDKVSLNAIVQSVGTGSFGPLLLLAGVITVSPLSGIPGMPTCMGVLVLLVAGQMVAGRDCFWLPGWLVRRSLSRSKLDKAVAFMRRPARFVDRWLRKRFGALIGARGTWWIALLSTLLGLSMPPMEVVPFSVNVVGLILMLFGLALIGRDGLFALLGLAFTALLGGGLAYYLLT